jgi:hypothetical protein
MEGVTPGPWCLDGHNLSAVLHCITPKGHPDAKHLTGDYVTVAESRNTWRTDAAWIARCSPAGIAPLLALIAQQAATIEDEKALRRSAEGVGRGYLRQWEAAEARATAAEAERDRLVAEEREACAKLASDLAIAQPVYGSFCAEYCDGHSDGSDATQAAITAAIRARAALSTAKGRVDG